MGSRGVAGLAAVHIAECRVVSGRWLYTPGELGSYFSTGKEAGLLEELHMGHPGEARMKSLARMFVWWPTTDENIEEKV